MSDSFSNKTVYSEDQRAEAVRITQEAFAAINPADVECFMGIWIMKDGIVPQVMTKMGGTATDYREMILHLYEISMQSAGATRDQLCGDQSKNES